MAPLAALICRGFLACVGALFAPILAVVVWFPTQRVLIMFYLKSLYTTTSFVQYLGFYSELRVDCT